MLRAPDAASQTATAPCTMPPAEARRVVLPMAPRPGRSGTLRQPAAATLFDFQACKAAAARLRPVQLKDEAAPKTAPAARGGPTILLPTAEAANVFTSADRLALLAWHNSGAGGYARLVIEDGTPGAEPDRGAYALLYLPGSCWAAFGVTRRASGIVAWHCGSGAAYGAFGSMAAALAALPRASKRAH